VSKPLVAVRNAAPVPLADVPEVPFEDLRRGVLTDMADGMRLAVLFGHAPGAEDAVTLYAVLAEDARSRLHVGRCRVEG